MPLKRYRGNTVREALALVRGELGPEALVMSTRLVADHGWRGMLGHRVVEVTASPKAGLSKSRPLARERLLSAALSPAGATLPGPSVRGGTAAAAVDRAFEPLVARLCAAGLDRALAADVARAVPRTHRRSPSMGILRRAIADRLEAVAAAQVAGFARAEVFIGPPGVGKTTTVAKIAAQARATRGTKVALLAADGFRVGAVEQLRAYAEIIGAPFAVARTTSALDEALAAPGDLPLLVDTAGRTARECAARELLEHLGGRPGVRVHLVLSAATPPDEARRLLDAYEVARPTHVALTRVDEAASLAPIVMLLRERRTPLSYLGTGQRVPEDLARATAPALAAHLLGEPLETGERA